MMRRKTFKTKKRAKCPHVRIRVYQFVGNMLCMKQTWSGDGWTGSANKNFMRDPAVRKENLCINRVLIRKGWM